MPRRTAFVALLALVFVGAAAAVGLWLVPQLADAARAAQQREWVERERRELAAAVSTRCVAPLEAFVRERPASPCRAEALDALAALRRDDALYAQVAAAGTAAAIDQFLACVPGHLREADARAQRAAMVPRDLFELLAAGEVEVTATGAGITAVRLGLRRLVPWERSVTIPAGSYFVASGGHQDMVATGPAALQLTNGEVTEVVVPAACANRPRPVPGTEDTFAVQKAPAAEELQRLAPLLARAGAGAAVAQAAVWIVTDDATFQQLGLLVLSSDGGISGRRAIDEVDAATAMSLCAEAGIDVERRAIAKDEFLLVHGLASPRAEVVEWCRARLERRGFGKTPVDIVLHLLQQREADLLRDAALAVVKPLSNEPLRLGLVLLAAAPEAGQRASAAAAFGRLADAADAERLGALVHDRELVVRIAAVRALRELPGDGRLVSLREALADPESEVVRVALEALYGHFDAGLLPILVDLARRNGPHGLRILAIGALGTLGGPEARAELLRQLDDDDETVCAAALGALGNAADPALVPVLIRQLHREGERFLRRQLLERLASFDGAEVAAELRRLLQDAEPAVRAGAVAKLGARQDPQDLPRLLHLANDPASEVRAAAVGVLGGFAGDSVAPALLHALVDTSPEVADAACGALAALRDPTTAPAVLQALRGSGGGSLRARGIDALEAIGGEAGTQALLALLDEPDIDCRWRAASALGRCAVPGAAEALSAALGKEQERAVQEVLQTALQALRWRSQRSR